MNQYELDFIRRAHHFFEQPGFLVQLTHAFSQPLRQFMNRFPVPFKGQFEKVISQGIAKVVEKNVTTKPMHVPENLDLAERESLAKAIMREYSVMTGATGAAGGLLGAKGVMVELPASTTLIFKGIARVGECFDFPRSEESASQEYFTIFSLGGPRPEDDGSETLYYTTRMGMQIGMNQLKKQLTKKFITQLIPGIGAVSAWYLNHVFTKFYLNTALYHFGLKWLEAKHGSFRIRRMYQELDLPPKKLS